MKKNSYTIQRNETGQYKWCHAPAYDFTLCTEGCNGEHDISVNGTGRPTLNDFIAVGLDTD